MFSVKDTVKRIKRLTTDWEKIFGNHVSDNGLGPEYINNFQTQQEKTNLLITTKKIKQTLHQRGYMKGKRTPERMLKIIGQYGYAI